MRNNRFFEEITQPILILLTIFTIILCNQNILEAETNFDKILNKEVVDLIKKFSNYKNPKLSAIKLLYDERYILNNDNTTTFKKHVLIKVLTGGGGKESTVYLPFNKYFQKMKINIARTIQPDGKVINIDPNVISEESPYYNLPIYSDIRIKKMTFPAVEVSSVMEYEVEYILDYKDLPSFSTMFMLPSNWHVALARFSVEVPKDTPVKFRAVRMVNPDPVVTSSKGRDIYSWEMNHVWVRGGNELFLPSYMKFGRYVIFSTIRNWEEISKGYKKLMQGQAELDRNIIKKAKELTRDIKEDKNEKIKHLYNYVSQNIQYVAIELGLSAFRPYPAPDVFKNRYGDCKGKSALLISMLKSVGIPAYYALVITTSHGFIESDVPTISFNHAIVAIPSNEGYLFVDPTAEMLPFGSLPHGVQGADVLILGDKEGEFVKIPVTPPDKNKTYEKDNIVIEVDGSIKIQAKVNFSGQNDWMQRLWAKYTPPGKYKKLLQQALGTKIPNIVLKDIKKSHYQNINEPFEIEFTAESSSYARKTGELFMFKVPCYLESVFASATAIERREAPLDILYPRILEGKTIVNFPKRYKVKYIPQNVSLDTPFISFNGEFNVEDDRIIINTKLTIKQREISNGKYPRFRNVISKVRELYNENIILEEKGQI